MKAPEAGATPDTVTVCEEPLLSPPTAQVNCVERIEHPGVEVDNEPRVAGNASDTVTPAALDGPAFVVVIVYEIDWPAVTAAGPDRPTARSAAGFTVVLTTFEVLFALLGSDVDALTTAWSVIEVVNDPDAGAVAVSVIVDDAPDARLRIVQVNVPDATRQPGVVVDGEPNPVGSGSVTTTLAAVNGPALETTMEYDIACPAFTTAGPVKLTARSAPSWIVAADADGAGAAAANTTAWNVSTTNPMKLMRKARGRRFAEPAAEGPRNPASLNARASRWITGVPHLPLEDSLQGHGRVDHIAVKTR